MAVYSGNLIDERNGLPIEGSKLWVYTNLGVEATLTDALDQPLAQPLVTDADGGFEYKTDDGVYRHDFWNNSVMIFRDNRVIVGTPATITASLGAFGISLIANATAADARSDLELSGTSGASLIGLSAGGSVQSAIYYVTPEMFGAVGNAVIGSDDITPVTLGTNDQTAFDNAVSFLNALGGGVIKLGPKTYRVNSGVRLVQNISLEGIPGVSKLFKPGTTTRAVTPTGVAVGGLVPLVYPDLSLPTNINAVVILDGDGGRWIGKCTGVTVIGSMSGTNFETDLETEFGIVSIGSVSDSIIENNTAFACKQAILLPDVFSSRVAVNRYNRCWRAGGINKGTSLTYANNYASSCRDYGHSLHDILYSGGGAYSNACDSLNDPTLYPTRTRISTAYIFDGLDGFNVTGNGQEQTYGRHYYIGVTNDCLIENNVSIGLGSDYVGGGVIAVWYIEPFSQNRTIIRNNPVINYMTGGLLQGAAVKANHYNVYCSGARNQRAVEWSGNTIRQNRYGAVGGNGWSKTTDAAYGGSLNPPMEKVEYNILYNGVANSKLAGDGVTAARTGTGLYNFTFDTAFANTNYIVTTGFTRVSGGTTGDGMNVEIGARTTTNVAIECSYYTAVTYDFERVDLTVTGFVDRLA